MIFFFFNDLVYLLLFLFLLHPPCCVGSSVVVVSGGYSLIAVCGFPIRVASRGAAGLQGMQASGLAAPGSRAQAQ